VGGWGAQAGQGGDASLIVGRGAGCSHDCGVHSRRVIVLGALQVVFTLGAVLPSVGPSWAADVEGRVPEHLLQRLSRLGYVVAAATRHEPAASGANASSVGAAAAAGSSRRGHAAAESFTLVRARRRAPGSERTAAAWQLPARQADVNASSVLAAAVALQQAAATGALGSPADIWRQVWAFAGAVHAAQLPGRGTSCLAQHDPSLPLRQRQAGRGYLLGANLKDAEAAAPQLAMQLLRAAMLLPPEDVGGRQGRGARVQAKAGPQRGCVLAAGLG
jgi:hypothetical protein